MQIEKLKYALYLTDDDRLIAYLRKHQDKGLARADIVREILAAGHAKNQAFILRLCEDWIFKDDFYRDGYYPRKFDPKGSDWRLVMALMKASAGVARRGGAKFAILSDNERGQHDWMVYWWFIPDRPWARRNIASGEKLLQTFAVENGLDLIPNRQRVERLRNDPHPSEAGNESIAENIFEYLKARHGAELARHRK